MLSETRKKILWDKFPVEISENKISCFGQNLAFLALRWELRACDSSELEIELFVALNIGHGATPSLFIASYHKN